MRCKDAYGESVSGNSEILQNSEFMAELQEYSHIIRIDVREDGSYSKIKNKENVFGVLRNKKHFITTGISHPLCY